MSIITTPAYVLTFQLYYSAYSTKTLISLTCLLIDSRFCFASFSAALIVASSESALLFLNASLVRLKAYSLFKLYGYDQLQPQSDLFTILPEVVGGKFWTFPKQVFVEWQSQRPVSSSSGHLREYLRGF